MLPKLLMLMENIKWKIALNQHHHSPVLRLLQKILLKFQKVVIGANGQMIIMTMLVNKNAGKKNLLGEKQNL